jgi:hypothetical protein
MLLSGRTDDDRTGRCEGAPGSGPYRHAQGLGNSIGNRKFLPGMASILAVRRSPDGSTPCRPQRCSACRRLCGLRATELSAFSLPVCRGDRAADRNLHRHSLRDVEAILDAHYLGRDIQLVEAAVLKLERKSSPALGWPCRRPPRFAPSDLHYRCRMARGDG